jgi:hypothetical protein
MSKATSNGKSADPREPTPDPFYILLAKLTEKPAIGGTEVAKLVLGSDDPKSVKSVFNLLEMETTTIPASKTGGRWTVYPSVLRAKRWSEERRAFGDKELFIRVHLLLTVMMPIVAERLDQNLTADEALQLAYAGNELIRTIEELLRLKLL